MSNRKKKAKPEDASTDYDVGYGKPPKQTQFKPGHSGNPRGRPKGTKNLKTDLMEELSEMVSVREGDRSQNVSKQRAVVKTLLAYTLKGDVRSAALLLSMMMRLTETGEGAPDLDDDLNDDEVSILEDFAERTRRPRDDQPDEDGGGRDEDAEDPS
jgi:hypothetical protein